MSTVKAFGKLRIPGIKFGPKPGLTMKDAVPLPSSLTNEQLRTQVLMQREMKLDEPIQSAFRSLVIPQREIDAINGFWTVDDWTKVKRVQPQVRE